MFLKINNNYRYCYYNNTETTFLSFVYAFINKH